MRQYRIEPQNTYNMDEKGFLLGKLHKTKRVVNKKAVESGKLLGSGQDGSREWISLLATICMDSTVLPPSIIYQAQTGNLQDTWLEDFKPDHQAAFFASSPNGWTSDDLGYAWLTQVFDRFTRSKARYGRDYRLLFVDGHSSHINMRFLNWCEKNKVLVAVYPPHSTHRLQPLDLALFSPLCHGSEPWSCGVALRLAPWHVLMYIEPPEHRCTFCSLCNINIISRLPSRSLYRDSMLHLHLRPQ